MVSRDAVAHFALRHNSAVLTGSLLDRIFDGANPRPDGTAAFYRLFGIERYRSADLIDGRADWKRDFNESFRLREQFDVATNFGTAEHVFNIGNMFRSMHDALRPGGVALHILPTFGDIDHGFFNIHPTAYFDLAAANDYVIEDLCYVDRWDIRDKVFAADVKSDFDFDALPIRLDHMKDRPKLQRMVTEMFIENYRREDTQRIGQQYAGVFYDYCCVALRKTGSAAFRMPMQGYYGGGAAMEKMGVRPNLSGIRRKNLVAWLRSTTSLAARVQSARERLVLRLSEEGIVKGLMGIVRRRISRMLPTGVRSRLRGLREFWAGRHECRLALLELAEKAKTLNDAGSSSQLRATLEQTERALTIAYGRHAKVSLRSLGRKSLSKIGGTIRSNVWLLEEVAARYLEIHKSECALHFEESELKSRVVNDLLAITIATDVLVPSEGLTAIRSMADLVKSDLTQIAYPQDYKVSKRWRALLDQAMRLALRLRDPRHIAYASMAMFDVGLSILNEAALKELSESCRKEYYGPHPELRGIGDSSLARPGTTVTVDGVPYSRKTEQGFLFYHEVFAALPKHERTDVVVEIGSGFGRLARIMRLAGRTKCFVLADLPESLLFAYAFLKVNLPDAKTHIIKSRIDIGPHMASEYDFIFCPIQLLAELRLDKVDLVVNTYSLSEMTQGCADHLMQCIHDVLRPRFLYSRNYMFTDKSIHFDTGGLDGEANEIVLKLRPEWQPLRFDLTASIGDQGYRVAGNAVLRRIAPRSVHESIKEMSHAASKVERGSPEWLGYMYLAALWADDPVVTEEFFAGLRQFFTDRAIDARPEFNFDDIGEVKFLRRRLKMAA
jgi:putative sugar O-methyltransferase